MSENLLHEIIQRLDQIERRLDSLQTSLERIPVTLHVSQESPRSIEPSTPLSELGETDPEAEHLWDSIRQQVKERIAKPSYETWFKPTAGYRINGDTLLVWTPNAFTADWLASRYSEMIHILLPDGDVKRVQFAWITRERGSA